MKNRTTFFLGAVVGGALTAFVLYMTVIASTQELKENPYFVLQEDYRIEDAGFLKKGTVIKFDEGMDEGFDRFVLYLNLKGGKIERSKSVPPDVIEPYWLNEQTTSQ